MKHRGKLFGAAIGFTLGGPIGALLGGTLGAAVDSADGDDRARFTLGLARFLVGVAGSDGPVNPGEMLAVRAFFLGQVEPSGGAAPGSARWAVQSFALDRLLGRALNDPGTLEKAVRVIRPGTDYEQRLFLLGLGYQVALSDGPLNRAEEAYLGTAAELLSLHPYDRAVIRARYTVQPGAGMRPGEPGGTGDPGSEAGFQGTREPENPYAVLGVAPGCSEQELHRAYRERAATYHPDRVSHLGGEFVELANRKFTAIQRAYERIKKNRGLR
ncbi:MAG: DnaJ domain-containing protein [Spirochaetota bacterium]